MLTQWGKLSVNETILKKNCIITTRHHSSQNCWLTIPNSRSATSTRVVCPMRAPGSSTCSPDNARSLTRGNRTDSSWTRDQETIRTQGHRKWCNAEYSLWALYIWVCSEGHESSYPCRAELARRLISFSSCPTEFCKTQLAITQGSMWTFTPTL